MNMLTLFISLRCNQSCAHCLYGCSPEHGEHMSYEVFKHAVLIARENRIPVLNFFGGEPLLNPYFWVMLEEALNQRFPVLLATNCRLLADSRYYAKFIGITRAFREKITVITARDKFHLRYFDPVEVVGKLRQDGYEVTVNDYADNSVLLSEFNEKCEEVSMLKTDFCCCSHQRSDEVGVLPNGGWTICPPSLVQFGDIFSVELSDVIDFKSRLPLRYEAGCSECMRDFRLYQRKFSDYTNLKI